MGVSLIVHPHNPYAPTSHANVRFFIATKEGEAPVWWFGGGFDLTPFYGFREDAIHWHRTAKAACAPFGADLYSRYKAWCDEYFFLKHRQEPRGVGGLFFDDVNEGGLPRASSLCAAWAIIIGRPMVRYWLVAKRRLTESASATFSSIDAVATSNLIQLYDRGTLFGLQSGGRTESILVSMPPLVRWEHDWQPEPGSPESALYEVFLQPRDWADE